MARRKRHGLERLFELLEHLFHHDRESHPPYDEPPHCRPPHGGPPSSNDPPPEPARRIPDKLTPQALAPLLIERISGTFASIDEPRDKPSGRVVVWVDHGDEVIVHLDSLQTKVVSSVLLVALDLETDQTGRQTLVVPLAPGKTPDDELTFVTEYIPRGHPELATRWGHILQDALFAAFEDMALVHAEERQAVAKALVLDGDALAFRTERAS